MVARTYKVEVRSDDEARHLATLTLNEQANYSFIEVRDRGRLVCIVRQGE